MSLFPITIAMLKEVIQVFSSTLRLRCCAMLLAVMIATTPAFAQAGSQNRPGSDSSLDRLEREVTRLSKGAGGVVGVCAVHLETGRRVSVNGSDRFPMASTVKVPIAVQILTRVDKGEIKLDQMIELKQSDLHPGSGTLTDLFNKPGVALSVRNLMELMLLISDNSATDVVLKLAGGGEAVTARMREIGIEGINVNRSTAQLIADWAGIPNLPPEERWSPDLFQLVLGEVKPEERAEAAKKFDRDPRDTSTPDSMTALLEKIYRRNLLKSESSDLLLDIMRRCRTGEARLRGLLPEGTEIAHKTGTIGGTANDVGIITLPDNAGHVAISVFVKSSTKDLAARERGIAEIARAVHDFFLFQPR
jgi:beta-lactamase class A